MALAPNPKESAMTTIATTSVVTVLAADLEQGIDKVQARLPQWWTTTGRSTWKSERHLLVEVEVTYPDDLTDYERNGAWVALTSYGISPADDLGSYWQTVEGIGR
jgi:hypothetical protein